MMCGVGTSSGSIPLLLTSGVALVALLGGGVGWLLLWGQHIRYGALSGRGVGQRAPIETGLSPLEALRERYAHGEIELGAFEEMATHLIRSPADVSRTQRDEPLHINYPSDTPA